MKTKPLWLKWIFPLIPMFLAGLMYFLLPIFPKFTEYAVTRGLFRVVAFPLEFLISLIPFSVTEIVVLTLPLGVLILVTVFVFRLFKKGHPIKTAEKGARFLMWVLSLFLLMFMLTDGSNFSRIPLGQLLDLPERRYNAEELYSVTCDLAKKASNAREILKEDENGFAILSVSEDEILKFADNSYDNLKKEYPFLVSGTTRVKSVALSHLWSYTGTTGVYCPWTLEANINTDIPTFDWGHTASHEVAHTMGFAKENECNFLGYLACVTSGQADYEYSGYLSAFIYASNALYKYDEELCGKAYGNLNNGVLRDLKQRNKYWKSFEGEVMESSQNVNDTFIKANGVESGILSYNQMVELLLRYYDKQGFFG